MRKLSLVTLTVLALVSVSTKVMSDSPHGKGFNLNCDLCHSSTSWKLDKTIYAFNHNTTVFPLNGQHQEVNCRACHPTLVFSDAKTACVDCHTDMHNQTVGPDCGRCHTAKSWIVENITEIHQRSRFPLLGAHRTADCSGCHKSASLLRFEPLGVQCYDCHQASYMGATNPNHVQGGFSKDCIQCHSINSISWNSTNVDHSFFPLTQGHAINCTSCHTNGSFSGLSRDCDRCHQANYAATTNPNHQAAHFPTTCADCHTTIPGWKPATFTIHNTYYPLTGAHTTVNCDLCHIGGIYPNTPNTCVGCHQANYSSSTNPNHQAANIPTTCVDCHTTVPGWKPATFTIHNTYWPLTGAHITTTCNQCHNGIYNNTIPTACVGCHLTNYNQTTNPPHASNQFGTDCQTCHTTNAWTPATFDHDGKYFPIYSGKHQGTWTLCTDCHTTPSNYGIFSCIDCHAHNNQSQLNNDHQGVGGYSYNSLACYSCHPTGSTGGAFNHNNGFPLTGAHLTILCSACHASGFSGTPTACSACHINAYNATTNPNHITANIPNTCATCHTTNPGWTPATFPTHNNYYALTGAHASITNCNLCHNGNYNSTPNTCVGCHLPNYNATTNPNHQAANIPTTCSDCHTTNPGWSPATFTIHNTYWPLTGAHITTTCNQCHNGNYNNTPNTCVGCHLNDYNQTTNPPHASAQFPTDCQSCHTTTAWIPSTFNHDGQYFPIYSGHHAGKWTLCAECHTNPSNYQLFSCIDCHAHSNQNNVNNDHQGVSGYSYNSAACYSCHPTGSSGGKLLKPRMNNINKQH